MAKFPAIVRCYGGEGVMKKSTSTCAANAQGGESLLFWGDGEKSSRNILSFSFASAAAGLGRHALDRRRHRPADHAADDRIPADLAVRILGAGGRPGPSNGPGLRRFRGFGIGVNNAIRSRPRLGGL